MRISLLLLVVCLAAVVPAEAQIYAWRDQSGTLVLSDRPRDGQASPPTYAVRGSTIRTTAKPARSAGANRYNDLIEEQATQHGVSPDLIRAVIQAESGFNPRAVSRKGAMGLMQLMPATARELGVANPFRPEENIRGGVTYLARLLAKYDQNVPLALAAYNAGPASVERYGNRIPPYRETQDYVKKITARTTTASPPAQPVIYKWTEVVDGREAVRYSNVAPTHTPFEVVGRR